MSREYHLITRDRPSSRTFIRTLTEVAGHTLDITGNFDDPDDYLNINAADLLLEVEPPGHVEAIDLDSLTEDAVLPEPDDEGCLWYTVATVPAAAPPISADIIFQTFQRIAQTHHGIAIDPQAQR